MFPRPVSRPQSETGEQGIEESEMSMIEPETYAPQFATDDVDYQPEYEPAPEDLDIPSVEPSVTELLGQETEPMSEVSVELADSALSGSFEMEDAAEQSLALSGDIDVEADEFTADSFETDDGTVVGDRDSFTMEEIDAGGSGVTINLNIGKTK